MKVKQTFNNNVVLTIDRELNEVVAMGRGIGFQKKKGDAIDEALIEKKFILSENVSRSIFPDIYLQLSEKEIDVIVEIIDLAEAVLGVEFQSNIYIALADHVHYALDRTQKLIPLTNPLNYEVKKYYPSEYEVGKKALEIIEKKLGISLYKDEAASIALHFVTGQKEGYLISQTIKVTEIIHHILHIVNLYFGTRFDEESISYARFMTHIQFFAHRIIFGEHNGEADSFLYDQIQESYPDSFNCVKRIKQYVQSTYNFNMGKDEEVYLTIHIERMMSEKKVEKNGD